MMYKDRIHRLEKLLEDQNKMIEKLDQDPNRNQKDYDNLVSEKSVVFNELARFRRLQWEEDHERISFEDDR